MKWLLNSSLLFILFACTQTITAQNTLENTMKPIDGFIEKMINESGIAGLGAAVIVDKQLVWTKGYGYADKENKVPFTPNTIMNIASITKTFTGVALMKAVEEKKLSLDEDINKYLPFKVINPHFPGEKITLNHLATHTSGITDVPAIYDSAYYYGSDSPVALGTYLKDYFDPKGKFYSKDNFLDKKPGSYRDYSNIGAALAGYIVEIATGKKLNQYTRESIFKPLKMNNTGWFLSEINLKNHSKLYNKEGDAIKPVRLYSLSTYPDGGVRTSVSELSSFFIALLNEGEYKGRRILKKESVEKMQKWQFTATRKPDNVNPEKLNSGIFWATKQGGTLIGHAGSDPGVKTEMLSELSKEVAVILFTNTSLNEKDMMKYHFGIFDELLKYGRKIKDTKATQNP